MPQPMIASNFFFKSLCVRTLNFSIRTLRHVIDFFNFASLCVLEPCTEVFELQKTQSVPFFFVRAFERSIQFPTSSQHLNAGFFLDLSIRTPRVISAFFYFFFFFLLVCLEALGIHILQHSLNVNLYNFVRHFQWRIFYFIPNYVWKLSQFPR